MVQGRQRRPIGAFTLIELMIAVCIIGVLASVAIPAFSRFVMEAKSGEIPTNLSLIYKGAAAYWERPFAGGRGASVSDAGHCVASSCCGAHGTITVPPIPPTAERRTYDYSSVPEAVAINFAPADPVYAVYAWTTPFGDNMNLCGVKESDFGGDWALIAWGGTDLDGDGQLGGMSLMAGIRNDSYYRAAGYSTVHDAFVLWLGAAPPGVTQNMTD